MSFFSKKRKSLQLFVNFAYFAGLIMSCKSYAVKIPLLHTVMSEGENNYIKINKRNRTTNC